MTARPHLDLGDQELQDLMAEYGGCEDDCHDPYVYQLARQVLDDREQIRGLEQALGELRAADERQRLEQAKTQRQLEESRERVTRYVGAACFLLERLQEIIAYDALAPDAGTFRARALAIAARWHDVATIDGWSIQFNEPPRSPSGVRG